jgi:hypothetical protein
MPTLKPLTHLLFACFFAKPLSSGVDDVNFDTIVTFGGGSLRPSGRSAKKALHILSKKASPGSDNMTGSFERLNDSVVGMSAKSPERLWPSGYANQQETLVYGHKSTEHDTDLPMERIAVRRQMDWMENKPVIG